MQPETHYQIGSRHTLISTYRLEPSTKEIYLDFTITPNIDGFKTGTNERLSPEKAKELEQRDGNITISFESPKTVKNIATEMIANFAIANKEATIKWLQETLHNIERGNQEEHTNADNIHENQL